MKVLSLAPNNFKFSVLRFFLQSSVIIIVCIDMFEEALHLHTVAQLWRLTPTLPNVKDFSVAWNDWLIQKFQTL